MNKNILVISIAVVCAIAIVAGAIAVSNIYGRPTDPEVVCAWSDHARASVFCAELAKRREGPR